MSLSAFAGGASNALEDILKQKFLEMVQRQQLAQHQQTIDQQGQRDAVNKELGYGNLGLRKQEFDASQKPAPAAPERPIVVGGRLVMPSTGKVVFEPPAAPPTPERPVSVSPGGRLVNPATGQVIYAAPERVPAGQAAAQSAAQTQKAEAKQAEASEVQQTLDLIQRLRDDKARPIATGPIEGRGAGRLRDNSGYERVKALHDQLVGRLQLAQAGKLKGQGQISDREREMLMKAATALTRTLADEDYATELQNIEDVLRGRHGMMAQPMPSHGAAPKGPADPLGLFKK